MRWRWLILSLLFAVALRVSADAVTIVQPGASVSPIAGYAHYLTGNSAVFTNVANQTSAMLFRLDAPTTFSKIAWDVTTTDAAGKYDICIYNSAGTTLIADISSGGNGVAMPSAGAQAFPTNQGSQTIAAGTYWFAYTGNSTTMKFEGSTLSMSLSFQGTIAATANGVCAASLTLGAITPTLNDVAFTLQ